MSKVDRRSFLRVVALAGGSLAIHLSIPACRESAVLDHNLPLTPFVEIDTSGRFIITAKNPEIGQGVKTALPMIIADEMGVPWERVSIRQADFHEQYGGQWAGGSLAVRLNWEAMRQAGALVRQAFEMAGAAYLEVPAEECEGRDARVIHQPSGRSVGYLELTDRLSEIETDEPENIPLKSTEDFTIIGTSKSDPDLSDIVSGRVQYCIDISLPDMVYASTIKPPVLAASVRQFDREVALRLPGIIDAFVLDNKQYGGRLIKANSPNFPSGVVLVGRDTWSVLSKKDQVPIEWDMTDARIANSQELTAPPDPSRLATVREDGNYTAAWGNTAGQLTATYQVPLLAHVPMEPMNCLARADENHCEIWAPTQNPAYLLEALTDKMGYTPEQVTIHLPRMGGGFGRRYYVDYALEAVAIARQAGRPVKMIWSREDDVRFDYYRPAARHEMQAGWDAQGQITVWQQLKSNASRNTSLGRDGDPWGTELTQYSFPAGLVPNLRFLYHEVTIPVPLGQWRAVAHSSNAFSALSFLDELAEAMQLDPVALYDRLLGPETEVPVAGNFVLDVKRIKGVLDRVVEISDWNSPLPPGEGKGIAAGYFQGAFVAEVVKVKVDEAGHLSIPDIWAAVDCGVVVNPRGAQAQVEGAILEGLSAAMYGKITIEDGRVQQSNFHDYRWIRMSQTPRIHTSFIDSQQSPGGLGEPPLPPVAPALCNAIYAASGQRIRSLPLSDHSFRF